MSDLISKIGNSIIHHGKSSDRIYLMSLDRDDLPYITKKLDELATKMEYTKIIAKVPSYAKDVFETAGFLAEAMIPKFYYGEEDGYFLCKYMIDRRKFDPCKKKFTEILSIALKKIPNQEILLLEEGFVCRRATEADVPDMTDVYRKVFKTYPFPIHDENYILKTMSDNVFYFGIWYNEKLIALSSIELAQKYSNAEMTDFAVLEDYRGNGCALFLLDEMEKYLQTMGVHTAFTIARAKSPGMNISFAKNGYLYGGTLIKNTDISGQIESMNVWYKYMN